MGVWDDSGKNNGAVTLDYLLELQDSVPAPSQIKSFVRQLEDAQRQRSILTSAEQIAKRAGKRFMTRNELAELEDTWQQSAFDAYVKSTDEKHDLEHRSNQYSAM